MKPIMTAAGVAALLLATAGESRAEPTYIEKIEILAQTDQDVKLTVYSNNLTCGPKTLLEGDAKEVRVANMVANMDRRWKWVVPISSVCNENKLARLEKNDVWIQIDAFNGSDFVCKRRNFKYQTGSGGTMDVWVPHQSVAVDDKADFVCGKAPAQ